MMGDTGDSVKVEVIDEGGNGRSGSGKPKKARKVQWGLLIGGIVLIAMGIAACVWPGATIGVIGMIVGIGFLVSGILAIADFFATGGIALFSGWMLLDGILSTLLGVLFLMAPYFTGAAMAWLLGIFVIAAGCMMIASSLRVHKLFQDKYWWLTLILGILTIIIGILFFPYPRTMSIFLGIFAIVYGVLFVVEAFHLPKVFA